MKPRPGNFDGKGIQPGASPIQLKSGDYLFLYNGKNKTTSIGYSILLGSDPTQVLQRSDKAIMEPKFLWERNDVTSNGLIKDPNGCPENASAAIGPEYAENIECFLGAYSGHETNINIFRIFVGWNTSTTTTPQSPTHFTTMVTFASQSTTMEHEKSTSHSSPETKTSTLASTEPTTTEPQKVGIIVKQHEISDKEAKDLAKTADRFQLNSNKISVNYDEMIGSGSTATVYKEVSGFLHGTSALSAENANKTALKQKYANCKVAINIPKEMSRNESEQIMRELQAMRQIGYHGHIAVLLGWCFQNDLPSLVFELAQQDLFKYIRKFREPSDSSCMPLKQILSIAWQVSVGMQHVASFNMVHRDLAARNILLYDGFHAKVDPNLTFIMSEKKDFRYLILVYVVIVMKVLRIKQF
uniref:Protein kinase domain-containing protein n=1 Tax=Panagrolaimus sp. ES5 TaxID=591445 RepID=A0AC34FM65_9BILA